MKAFKIKVIKSVLPYYCCDLSEKMESPKFTVKTILLEC